MPALLIAIVGAESTGKSALAQALALSLAEATGLRCAAVPEVLRGWCDAAGRTPQSHEQAAIATQQTAAIDTAAQSHDLLLCDTTALMTAVYSELLFQDRSLLAAGLAFHRRCDLTLLTAVDLPWVADGLQRDGPQVRGPVDAAIRRTPAGGRARLVGGVRSRPAQDGRRIECHHAAAAPPQTASCWPAQPTVGTASGVAGVALGL